MKKLILCLSILSMFSLYKGTLMFLPEPMVTLMMMAKMKIIGLY